MKQSNKNYLLVIMCLIGVIGTLFNITHDGLWCDEAYTVLLMRCSFADLLHNLKFDAHPPLYFIVLKAFTVCFGSSVLVMRLFSVIGLICLAFLGFGPVKRLLGSMNGILFCFLCLYLPISVSFAQEARMYTWICFLITGMVLYGYFSVYSNQRKDWALYTAFSIGAIYVHIYGLIIFLTFTCIAFFWLLFRNKKLLKSLLLCSGIVLIAYIPWLHVTLFQAARASQTPWFVKTSIPQIVAPLLMLFTDRFLIINFIPSFVIIVLLSYYLFFRATWLALKERKESFPILIFGILLSTFLVAVTISILVAPILMPRYAFAVFGIFLITIIYGVMRIDNKRIRLIIGILLLLLFIPERIHVHANRINGPLPEIQAYLKNRTDASQVFLHSNEHTFTTFSCYFPQNMHYLYDPGLKVGIQQFTRNGFRVNDWRSVVKDRNVVWVINKMETHINKYVSGPPQIISDLDSILGFVKTLESDTFKVMPTWYPGRIYSNFEMNPCWFQVKLSRYEKSHESSATDGGLKPSVQDGCIK
jgi:hypothetical protein